MDEMIGYCGYCCHICAGRSNDIGIRRKMVKGWKKIYGHTMYTEDNMPISKPCGGCKGPGDVADTVCQARPCAREKGVELCADCEEFPCKKVSGLLAERLGLLLFCFRKPDATKEEYDLCAKQFEDSMANSVKRLIELGKVPSWAKDMIE